MITLHQCKGAVAVAALFVVTGSFAQTMNKGDFDTSKDRIGADYKAAKAACDNFSGNQKDICVEQAKGKEKVAKAELEHARSGKIADANKVSVAKADATYAVAKETCDDKAGNVKDVCVREAKTMHDKALADAKMNKKVGEARKDAGDDKRDADYKLATEKCDGLSGDAKSACVSAAKTRFGKT